MPRRTSFTQMAGASALSGSFSADQRATLTEVNSYRLTTGELVRCAPACSRTVEPRAQVGRIVNPMRL